jgi:hypothetical protein
MLVASCGRLSRPQSTMSRSEVPRPFDTPTLRLAVPTCVSGEVGCSSQVLVRFFLDMPYSLTPVESTEAHL